MCVRTFGNIIIFPTNFLKVQSVLYGVSLIFIYFRRILIEQGGLKIDEMVDDSGMTTIHIAAVNQKATRLDFLISKVSEFHVIYNV